MKRALLITSLLLLASACTDDGVDLETPDSGVVVAADAGVVADAGGPVDTGIEPDAGVEPARRLVEYRILGDSPLDNLVISPNFDLYATVWFPFSLDGQSSGEVSRYHFTDTPTKQPALGLRSPRGMGAVGMTRSSAGPLALSVWIGQEGKEDARFTTQVTLVGVDTSGREVAFDLIPDQSTRIVLGSRVWIRYWGMAAEGPVGFGQFYLQELGPERIYVSGPVVIPASETGLSSGRLPARHTLSANERHALRLIAEAQRQRLGEPSPIGIAERRH